jgi:formylglycine-generating enzyme required for sulfatase activity
MGRYLCLTKGNWEAGLPLLALSGDAKLKDLAKKELAKPGVTMAQVELADGWSEFAENEKQPAKANLQRRALRWYQQALPELTGLTKTRVEKTVQELVKLTEPKKSITNSIGMKLAWIPQGEFLMGSPDSEANRQPHEGPQHEVEITRPFYMGVYEVTQEEYEMVMKTNPSYFSATGGGKAKVQGMDTKRFPAEQVSWDETVDFCKKLTDLPEEKKAGRVYRLPTEAEWEYACRANTKTIFQYGNSLSSAQANFNGDSPYGGTAKGPNLVRPTEVGSYQPNAFGLYDMHGNVWEWCQDEHGPYTNETQKDPQGPPIARYYSRRVLRGGSWDVNAPFCRAAFRARVAPGDRSIVYGFRVVLTEPEKLITNSIGMNLAYIPPGEFTMGSPENEANRRGSGPGNEGPQHKVKITKYFYMGVYEVKQSEYEKVMGKNPSVFKDNSDNPVEQVNWGEAAEFCKKLSELPEEIKAGRVYRLPTEAEWEYACRAGTTTVFHYGNSLSSKQANFNGEEPYGGAEKGPKILKTVKCGSYQPNAWGFYDMHGNVWEWCLDGPRTYTPNPVNDPRGSEAAGGIRVLRGGPWLHPALLCRSAARYPDGPDHRNPHFGFRVMLVR